jgi:3-hydroxyacyl-CoA dehydrogenase
VAALDEALAGVAWVQENLPETLDVKREVFAALDRQAPPYAVLASSTSAIPASQFTEALPGRARCLVAHPVNPPHLVPIVELCGAPWTSPAVIEQAKRVYAELGQVPIVVRREVDGFILNRLQGALLSEAMRLVGEGYVSAEDLDKTVCAGLGLRWSFMGPLATIELNARVADYCTRYSGFYPDWPRRAGTVYGTRPTRRRSSRRSTWPPIRSPRALARSPADGARSAQARSIRST